MQPRLPALEKNILKFRALQMVLLLHKVESLRTFLIGSIRRTDSFRRRAGGVDRLHAGARGPMQKALAILVDEKILTSSESEDLQAILDIRNQVGHAIHELVQDISAPPTLRLRSKPYDYDALARFERYERMIERGMMSKFALQLSYRGVIFEQAEATYREELARLHNRIERQLSERRHAAA